MFFRKVLECKPGSFYRERFNNYLKSKNINPLSNADNLAYVAVDQYIICDKTIELITNGLNYCIGLGIALNDKVFLAHLSRGKDSLVKATAKKIKKEFGIKNLCVDGIKLKIYLGAAEDSSSAVYTVLKLLSEIGLIDLFLKNIQQYIINNPDKFSDLKLQTYKIIRTKYYFFRHELDITLEKFLSKKVIRNDSEILLVAEFINKIKHVFVDSSDCALEKIGCEDFARTNDLVTLQVQSSLSVSINFS